MLEKCGNYRKVDSDQEIEKKNCKVVQKMIPQSKKTTKKTMKEQENG